MPKTTAIQCNFSAGELSPLLDGRVDITRYYNGAKTLENFIILPYGGIKRRPGTYYVAEVADSTKKSRLIPFQFSVEQAYIVELGDMTARFYANHGQLLSAGAVYSISTSYLEADLPDLQFAQDADTMWIVHPSYKPRELTRGVNAWDTYTKLMLHMDGTDGSTAFVDEITKTVTANGNVQIDTAQYKFNGASGLFDGNGDYLSLADSADFYFAAADFTIDFWVRIPDVTTPDYPNFFELGITNNAFQVGYNNGAVNGVVVRYRKADTTQVEVDSEALLSNNIWHHIAIERHGNNLNIYVDGDLKKSADITGITLLDPSGNTTIGKADSVAGFNDDFKGWMDEFRICKGIARYGTANFTPPVFAYEGGAVTFALANYAPTADPFVHNIWVTLTAYTLDAYVTPVTPNGYYYRCTVAGTTAAGEPTWPTTIGTTVDDGTVTWRCESKNPVNFPSCVSIYEQRLCFANTRANPQKVWASVSGDFEDMTIHTDDPDAFAYTIGSEQVNAIRWLSAGRVLGMGTLGGVFSMSSGNDELPITPTTVVVKRETSYGALGIVPKKIGNMVYYVQRNAKTIREFGYSYDMDEYTAFDATLLAEHITGLGIVDMDYQQSPYNMLWCVRSDGEIAVLTRQIDQEVIAWSRIVTDGYFESVAVIPGDGGDDEVWVTVKRYINNSWVRYVEYFKPMDFGDEQEDAFFVDCGLTLDNPKTITSITKASPGVVTTGYHGFSNGDIVVIRGVLGMTEVNQIKFKVANKTDTTFELTDPDDDSDIDTSAYTTYVSGGEVRKCVTSVSGATHLAAETIDVCIDGVEGVASAVSAGGVITITTPANGGGEIHAGLNYVSTLKTLRLEAGSAQGTAQSKLKRIQKVYAMIVDSLEMEIGNEDRMVAVVFDEDTLYSGWKDITFPSLWDRDGYIIITQEAPLPLTILSSVIYMTTSDV